MTSKARTVFLGTGAFAVPILSALAEQPALDLATVISAPERAASRGKRAEPPVVAWAGARGIPVLRPPRLRAPDVVAEISDLHPDLLVLADYGQIVPRTLLELAPHGALNVHPSLLPRYRGATPIPAAILGGDTRTGVTLMRMDPGLDTGPIVDQWAQPLTGDETALELEAELAELGARLLVTTLPHWLAGEIEPVPQTGDATLTRPLSREDGRLDPSKTAAQLERQVRAYQPWPGSFLDTPAGRVVVWSSHVAEERPAGAAAGTIVRSTAGGLALTASDSLLDLDEVQPAGGRRMTSKELVLGRPGLIGSVAS